MIRLKLCTTPIKGVSQRSNTDWHGPETYLKQFGVLENSSRAVWALTEQGRKIDNVDPKEVIRMVRDRMKKERSSKEGANLDEALLEVTWQNDLFDTLANMEPSAFERLIQRLLRESGFVQVEVTGRSGDGGIDGRGIMRLGGMMSFHVIFQCKRWRSSVGSSVVRDFRGAMVGRADKGLLITTGTFSKDAVQEAIRDGAPAIDLIDGDQLMDKLKNLGLGVLTRKIEIEEVTIDHDWFTSI